MKYLLPSFACLALIGCGTEGALMAEPVDASGKIIDAGGKPVAGVEMVLQPMQTGRPAYAVLGGDGSFKVTAVPGKYAFYFQTKNGGIATMVPEKYREGRSENTMTISKGANLEIKLNP